MEKQLVHVALGERSYDIHIQAGLISNCAALLAEQIGGSRALIISDEQVAAHYGDQLVQHLKDAGIHAALCSFPGGEPNKSLQTAEQLWKACAEHNIDRSSTLIALGGGITGDLCGYVAACWMRGIQFIQIPSSLLAMVDSSVGGKTGVNSLAGKNLIGAFKQPSSVIIDPMILHTMDQREYSAGLAEVLKYGIIYDQDFFTWQEQHADALVNRDPAALTYAIAESCRIKAHYVCNDEHEHGIRAHLNYGHTFGHALEKHTQYTSYLHGEAVGIGMRMAAQLSASTGLLKNAELIQRQDALLKAYGLPLVHACGDSQSTAVQLGSYCSLDKKVSKGKTRFVLVQDFADIHVVESPDPSLVEAAFASALSPTSATA